MSSDHTGQTVVFVPHTYLLIQMELLAAPAPEHTNGTFPISLIHPPGQYHMVHGRRVQLHILVRGEWGTYLPHLWLQ